MLAHTMQKLHCNTSPSPSQQPIIPRKIHSSIITPTLSYNTSRSNLRTQYTLSPSTSCFYPNIHRKQSIQRQSLNPTDRKPQHPQITIPYLTQLRDTITPHESREPSVHKAQPQKISNRNTNNRGRYEQPIEIQSERELLTMKNSQLLSYQQKILKLEDALSDSLSDKLTLQLKLNRSIQQILTLQSQLTQLQTLHQHQLSTLQKNTHSLTLSSHTEYITRLLLQYDQTKTIIEKLIQDNEMLMRRNEEFGGYEVRHRKEREELERVKIVMVQVEGEKLGLVERVEGLREELDWERGRGDEMGSKLEQMRRENQEMMMILQRKDEQILSLTTTLNHQNQDRFSKNKHSLPSIYPSEQLLIRLSKRDEQILQLNYQLTQMQSKLKEMLKQLMTFSHAYQTEKRQKYELSEIYSTYRIQTQLQLARLNQQLNTLREPTPFTNPSRIDTSMYPLGNTIYIEASDLKETKTRISGGYEEVILKQKPPIPVVTKVRTIMEEG